MADPTKGTLGLSTLSGLGTFGGGSLGGGTPSKRWMTPGWCGCCTCTYFLDKYTRADNNDLGGNWTESAGSWEIENYRLITSSGTGLCLCDVENDHDEHVVSASLRGMAIGDQARLVSSKIIGEDSYWFAEVTWQATTATIELYQRTTGSDTQRGGTTTLYNMRPSVPLHIRIGFDSSTICLHYRRDTGDIWTEAVSYSAGTTDSMCGVGTGTVNDEVRFDDFRLEQHGTLYERCPKCESECYSCSGAMADEFLIVPTGDLDGIPAVKRTLFPANGYVVRRHMSPASPPGSHCLYRYRIEPPVAIPGFATVGVVHLSLGSQGLFGDPVIYPRATIADIRFVFSMGGVAWRKIYTPPSESQPYIDCAALSASSGFFLRDPYRAWDGPPIDWEITAI